MRVRSYRVVRYTLLAALLCWSAPALRGEVSVVHRNASSDVASLIVSPSTINEDADPIPALDIGWQLYRSVPSNTVLNSTGDIRDDGPPDLSYRHSTRRPLVVWAYDRGAEHDIAFSEWIDSGWSTEHFLTSAVEDELDPRLFVGDADEVFVVWWVSGPDPRVMLTSRATDLTGWRPPTRVSPPGEFVSRPTVAVFQGVVRVAYVRRAAVDPTSSRELVVRRLETDDTWVEEHVIGVPRTDRLDPVLHVGFGRMWMDWKHSTTQFGSSRFVNANWTAPMLYDWSDPSWVGAEGTRRFIRRSLLSAADVVDVGP